MVHYYVISISIGKLRPARSGPVTGPGNKDFRGWLEHTAVKLNI